MPEETWKVGEYGNIVTSEGKDVTSVDVYETIDWRSNRDYRLAIIAPVMYSFLRRVICPGITPVSHKEILELLQAIDEEPEECLT
jgi:hypothetical protein